MKKISDGFGGLTSLLKQRMHKCEDLEEFAQGLTNLVALEKLNFEICVKILEWFGCLLGLNELQMWECDDVV